MASKAEKKPAKKKTAAKKPSEEKEKAVVKFAELYMLAVLRSRSTSSTTEKKKLSLKLLIDTKSNKVLFAKAGKDVVDFMLSLLGMPVASIVKILSKNENPMVGSIANLYKSLEDLDDTYLDPKLNRAAALNPVVSSPPFSRTTLLLPEPTPEKRYYTCHKSDCLAYNVTDVNTAICPSCFGLMTSTMTYVDPKTGKVEANAQRGGGGGGGGGGFVKAVVTYIIMDDLTVIPLSTISTITLLNRLGVKDLLSLQEKPAELGFKEGVELLKASLYLTTVLTQVFLVKKKK